MATKFTANFIHTSQDDETIILGFADNQFETKEYVLLQRMVRPSQQDIAMGDDQLHLTINDESRSRYGGVRAVKLNGRLVEIELEPNAAAELEVESLIEITISQAAEMEGLEQAFQRIAPELFSI